MGANILGRVAPAYFPSLFPRGRIYALCLSLSISFTSSLFISLAKNVELCAMECVKQGEARGGCNLALGLHNPG